jgi:hypothetical protein
LTVDCPEGHICANDPIHAQAKIIRQRQQIEELRVILERSAAFWRPVAADLEHGILSIDSVRFLAQDFLAMLQPTLSEGGES